MSDRIYNAIVLNDYADNPYAQKVKEGTKLIETRMYNFHYRGDLVICCGKTNSVGKNRGKALCIVEVWKCRSMLKRDIEAACIGWDKGRYSILLKNWRHFSEDFEFTKQYVSGAWQSLFQIRIPKGIRVIQANITPYRE